MNEDSRTNNPSWSEENSSDFVQYGKYFVPDREEQIEIICSLLLAQGRVYRVLELCCGEGLLAASLLERIPNCQVIGLDGSPTMIKKARQDLAIYGERFRANMFNLSQNNWRHEYHELDAIVSSLAIHHLEDEQKRSLFEDCFHMLAPGGLLVIADLIEPASEEARTLAANAYDEAVQQRALALNGDLDVFEKFQQLRWNLFRYPDEMDKPSGLTDMLDWLRAIGYSGIDVYWLKAGHAIFGGYRGYKESVQKFPSTLTLPPES